MARTLQVPYMYRSYSHFEYFTILRILMLRKILTFSCAQQQDDEFGGLLKLEK
jgi:hypothetical protein